MYSRTATVRRVQYQFQGKAKKIVWLKNVGLRYAVRRKSCGKAFERENTRRIIILLRTRIKWWNERYNEIMVVVWWSSKEVEGGTNCVIIILVAILVVVVVDVLFCSVLFWFLCIVIMELWPKFILFVKWQQIRDGCLSGAECECRAYSTNHKSH